MGARASPEAAEEVLVGHALPALGRQRLPAGGAGLRRRLTPLAARGSPSPYVHTILSGRAPRAPPREREQAPRYDARVTTVPLQRTPFATIEEAVEDIRQGKFVVVVDDEDRENEGDLTIAAQFATPEAVNFMVTHARGLVCLCLTEERCDELGLRQMTEQNETPFGTAFTVSVEAREGVSTGISAHDRSHTI